MPQISGRMFFRQVAGETCATIRSDLIRFHRQGDRVEYDIEIVRSEPYEVRGPLLRPSTSVNPAGSPT